PVLIHPELQSTLLMEMKMKFAELLKKLKSSLEGKKLAAGVIAALMSSAEAAVQLAADENAAKAICDSFDASGKQLSEQFGRQEIKLSVELPSLSSGLTADQVRALMAEETAKAEENAKKLAEQKAGNVKLL